VTKSSLIDRQREGRRVQILTALGEVIRGMEYDGLMGVGNIKIGGGPFNPVLELPIQEKDSILWEEILHDDS